MYRGDCRGDYLQDQLRQAATTDVDSQWLSPRVSGNEASDSGPKSQTFVIHGVGNATMLASQQIP